jgi:chemotaxis protein methyltransferase CheR
MESQEFDSGQPRQELVSNGKKSKESMPRRQQMSKQDFEKIRELIYHKSGLYHTDKKKRLFEDCISKRMNEKKMKNFDEYLKFLKSPFGRQEMNNMFETQTVSKTYFFRAEHQFQAFEKIIVPKILEKKGMEKTPIIKIWSSATCTGEEAYTLA